MDFAHLHVHTHYSILDAHSLISDLFERVEELQMPAIAITDHGNLYGAKEFFNCAKKHPTVKPIIGCEVYVSKGNHREYEKQKYHLVLLAKNYLGYKNLMKIVSEANVYGYYYKPRISHEFIQEHSEGLICLSGCEAGELPQAILSNDLEKAEQIIQWHKGVFGDDYYLEVMKHNTELPDMSNELYEKQCLYCDVIFRLAEKYRIKVVATNDVHFVRAEDASLHDRLLCLETNSFVDDPYRRRYTQQEYLKTEEEMLSLFPEHPEVLTNTIDVVNKVEAYSLDRDIELPVFQIDAKFERDLDKYLKMYIDIIKKGSSAPIRDKKDMTFQRSAAYLCHLTFKGAEKRYGSPLPFEHKERLEYELIVILRRHCPDYFLIVQDLVAAMKAKGVMVGPGRGSVAGSAVCYCLGITNVEPIENCLLFERFLNPDQITLPSIDLDFENHKEAMAYLKEKYGADHVCQVISFATLGRSSAIKAVSRINHQSIKYGNKLAELASGHPDNYKDLLDNSTGCEKEILLYAKGLEKRIHHVSVHACAVVIGREPISDYVPLTRVGVTESGEDLIVSQYDGKYVDECGLLMMNLLGLHPLAVINDCQKMIRERYGEGINVDAIPLDDAATYKLYERGDTVGVFQFESSNLRPWLERLHPREFDDLIAINALYRPGPMDYLPLYCAKKNGEEAITYELPEMEEFLCDTYGVTIYQEQIMLLSRKLAGFSKTEADLLRRSIVKRKTIILAKQREQFINGGIAKGFQEEILCRIWDDWVKRGPFMFNKSHSACYALISYQTAWLKRHYPEEFFTALLDNACSAEDAFEIIKDCNAHGIEVFGPDVNKSVANSYVDEVGNIRQCLNTIAGLPYYCVDSVVRERAQNGEYESIYDLIERTCDSMDHTCLERLLSAGALECLGCDRENTGRLRKEDYDSIDELLAYGRRFSQEHNNDTPTLFSHAPEFVIPRPNLGFDKQGQK